jgi:electron transport complex protein RnfB
MTAAPAADLSTRLDALLPQTQCGQCGYAGCRPYADAMAQGEANINRCPPGGAEVIDELARLLARAPLPLDPSCGVTQPPAVALIDETWCIGCTLCIQACPVDAIVGAAKLMHTVIAEACTGCALCIPPCPVDCIQMIAVERAAERNARRARADQWRARYVARQLRLEAAGKTRSASREPVIRDGDGDGNGDDPRKRAAVARALVRAQERIQKTV